MDQEISDLTQPKEPRRLFFRAVMLGFDRGGLITFPPPNEMSGGRAAASVRLAGAESAFSLSTAPHDSHSVLQYKYRYYCYRY